MRIAGLVLVVAAVGAVALWGSGRLPLDLRGAEAATGLSMDQRPAGEHRPGPPAVPVTTAAAEEVEMPLRRRTIGFVTTPAQLSVTSETSGLVTELVAGDGAMVKAGDVIVRLDRRAAQAAVDKDAATLARDLATLDGATRTRARQETLQKTDAVSQQSYEDALTAERTAAATVDLDRAALAADQATLDDKDIRAPFAGRLGAVGVVPGSLVQPGTGIVTLTQLTPLRTSFSLAESDAEALRTAMSRGPVPVTVTATGVTDGHAALLDFVDSDIDEPSGTLAARATLTETDSGLTPGRSVAVEVELSRRKVVAVPAVALQTTQKGPQVYVVGADGTVTLTPVAVAIEDGDRVGVASGLRPGDRVVVEGQGRIADGIKVAERTGARDAFTASTSEGRS